MASDEKPSGTSYGKVQMDTVEINADRPLPHYNSGPIKAYEAVVRGEYNDPCFALICEKHLTPRLSSLASYASMGNDGIAQLAKWGSVYWPPAAQERFILVYRNMLGNPLMAKEEDKGGLNWKHEAVIETVVKPMVNVFEIFRDRDFIHGSIRVENMFDGGNAKMEKVVLGECMATPVSYTQPVLYETIYRSMTDPIARGKGSQADDLYSFGVALTVFMRARDPLKGMSDHEIIRQKVEHGTYAVVTGRDRFTGPVLELLRGLLNDDPTQRWNLEEIKAWLDGRRLTPRQAWRFKKAARPLTIADQKYFNTPLLAMDLELHHNESVNLIESGEMDQWIQRSLEDNTVLERYTQAMIPFRDGMKSPGYHDRMLHIAAAALDPQGPLRYRGTHIMAEGLGAAITEKVMLRQDLKTYNDIIGQGMALNWTMSQDSTQMDTGGLLSRLDSSRSFLRHQKLGYGFERCLYYLNPDAPCASDKLKDYAVYTGEDLLRAFESLAKKGKASPMFFDRHSIAFLSVKDRRCIDANLFDLNAREEYKRLLAEIRTMALLQQSTGNRAVPAIAQTYLKRMPSLIARFHDRHLRQKLKALIDDFANAGDMVKMAQTLTSPDTLNRDFHGFREAVHEYALLERENETLERNLANKKNFSRGGSQDIAAIVSCVVAVLIIIALGFMNFIPGQG